MLSAAWIVLPLAAALPAPSARAAESEAPLRVCGDALEWPPFTFRKRVAGAAPGSGEVTGASVELVRLAMGRVGVSVTVDLVDWLTCQAEVKVFAEPGQFEAWIDGTFSRSRDEDFFLSHPLYWATDAYWYDTGRFREPPVGSMRQVAEMKVCGVKGYSLEHYGLRPGQFDDSAPDTQTVLDRLSSGECEIFANSMPVVLGLAGLGRVKIPDGIRAELVPDGNRTPFHLGLSRASPRAARLVDALNRILADLHMAGEAERVFKQYLPCGTRC